MKIQIEEIINEVLQQSGKCIDKEKQLNELLDSLMFMKIVIRIEEIYHITFEDERLINKFKSVDELVEYVKSLNEFTKSE